VNAALSLLDEDPGDCRETPPDLFDALNAEFHFTIDVAANERNAKCDRYYTREQNGLDQAWARERVFCNPPYSDIEPWVRKASTECLALVRPEVIVMLLPADRTERKWWQRWVEPMRDRPGSPLRTRNLPGRPKFWPAGLGGPGEKNQPKFGCVLLIWVPA
jgi:phage N-6-adenine-methyltransferase